MGKIFCLMGKSSSGKDTIFKELSSGSLGLKPVIPYTTRPKRSSEVDGREYYFISVEALEQYVKSGKVIEQRVYNTVNGKWYYCTIDDGQIDLSSNSYLLITTLEAFEKIQRYFGIDRVVPIYIELDDGERLERALQRERHQEHPNYEELCRRFIADNQDFSLEKLKSAGIKKHYANTSLEDCVKTIKRDIRELLCRCF